LASRGVASVAEEVAEFLNVKAGWPGINPVISPTILNSPEHSLNPSNH
jgi:hypothetical protein